MHRVVWTGVMALLLMGMTGRPASPQSPETRRQARIERQERIRERLAERREALRQRLGEDRFRRLEARRQFRLDRNRDGRVTRGEIARYRAALRRAIRRAYR